MGYVVTSTDYIYEYDEQNVRISIGERSGSSLIQFYVSNRLVYYRPVSEVESEITTDYELIQWVMSNIRGDRDRWLPSYEMYCDWLICNFDVLVYLSRRSRYIFDFEDTGDKHVLDVEDFVDGMVKMRFHKQGGTDKVFCEFNMNTGTDLLNRTESFMILLTRLLEAFKINQSEVGKATLAKNIQVD